MPMEYKDVKIIYNKISNVKLQTENYTKQIKCQYPKNILVSFVLFDELEKINDINMVKLHGFLAFRRDVSFLINIKEESFIIFTSQNNFDSMIDKKSSRKYISNIISAIQQDNQKSLFGEEFSKKEKLKILFEQLKIKINDEEIERLYKFINNVLIITYRYDDKYLLSDFNLYKPLNPYNMELAYKIDLLKIINDFEAKKPDYINEKTEEENPIDYGIKYNEDDDSIPLSLK